LTSQHVTLLMLAGPEVPIEIFPIAVSGRYIRLSHNRAYKVPSRLVKKLKLSISRGFYMDIVQHVLPIDVHTPWPTSV
jgi:hypothetical protein